MSKLKEVSFLDIVLNTVYYMLLLDGREHNVKADESKFP